VAYKRINKETLVDLSCLITDGIIEIKQNNNNIILTEWDVVRLNKILKDSLKLLKEYRNR